MSSKAQRSGSDLDDIPDIPESRLSYAQRVGYIPFDIENNVTEIEKQYLLGGKGDEALTQPKCVQVDDFRPPHSDAVIIFANILSLVLGFLLFFFCIYDSVAAVQLGERCPLLIIGALIAAFSMINSVLGLYTVWSSTDKKMSYSETLYYLNHMFGLVSTLFLILLAVATIIHWDVGGQPAHTLFHHQETVGIQHRYMIWGASLAIGLSVVVLLFGTLGRDWQDEDNIFKYTVYACCSYLTLSGLALMLLGFAVWYHKELPKLDNPVPIFGAVASGAATVVVSLFALTTSAERPGRITTVLLFLPLASLATILFSIMNAYSAEPARISDRRTNTLLSALIGLTSQLVTVIALNALFRWRHYINLKPS